MQERPDRVEMRYYMNWHAANTRTKDVRRLDFWRLGRLATAAVLFRSASLCTGNLTHTQAAGLPL